MKGLGRISAAIGAGLAGIGAAVFLHPRSGARHRQAAAGVARRRSAYVATMVGATVAGAPGRGGRKEEELASNVRAELSARHVGAAGALMVSAHRSTVTLRGEVTDIDDIALFEATARSVSGVGDVNNLLRLSSAVSPRR
jgi:osmotically-inducible protein OsmY